MEAIAGGSYEWYGADGYSAGGSSNASGGIELYPGNTDALLGMRQQWFNAVAGVQIHTSIRGLGLIEYGLLYHHPFGTLSPEHRIILLDDNGLPTQSIESRQTLRAGYLDFKVAYYFLNFRKDEARVSYR